jgi:hypothetical protein
MKFHGWSGHDELQVDGPIGGGTSYAAGDANTDGRFNQSDIVLVLQAAKYLTGEAANWREGDWTLDGVFDQSDIIAALQTANYLREPG